MDHDAFDMSLNQLILYLNLFKSGLYVTTKQ